MPQTAEAEVLLAESLGAGMARWQLPRFDQTSTPPTAQKLEDIEAAAYQDGFQRGQAEGFAAGQKTALAQAQAQQNGELQGQGETPGEGTPPLTGGTA